MQMLAGYKTYFIAAAMAIYAVAMFWNGTESQPDMIKLLFAAAGLAGLRSGVATEIQNVLTALGIQLPPSPSNVQVKTMAKVSGPLARVAPLFFVLLFVGASLTGCASAPTLTPQQTFQGIEAGFALAEATYDAICSVNSPPTFCTAPGDVAAYAKAKIALEAAFTTAQAAISASGNLDSASIDALLQAVSADWAAYNQIVNATQAKQAARLGIAYHPIPL